MKFMVMMNTAAGPFEIASWAAQDVTRHMEFMATMNKNLAASGELVGCEGLAAPDQAKLIRAGKSGEPITDGVFPESKEFLVGYSIVDVEGPERVYELAAQISAAPGKGGVPLNMAIEVRQVMSI